MATYKEFFRENVEDFLLNSFKSEFSSDCLNVSSPQNVTIIQGTRINNEAILRNCPVRLSQNLNTNVKSFCIDIPKMLNSMNTQQKESLINRIVEKLRTELSTFLVNRNRFINTLCDKLKKEFGIIEYIKDIKDVYDENKKKQVYNEYKRIENLPNRESLATNNPIIKNFKNSADNVRKLEENQVKTSLYNNIFQSCSQEVLIDQQQTITLKGNFDCQGRSITVNQDLFLDIQMNCIIKPLLNNLKNDAELQRLYVQGDSNCSFYKKYGSCINGKRKVNRIFTSKEDCANIEEEYFENCQIPKCQISNWSRWSICNFNENGKPTRFRTRKFIKQGEECNNIMREEEECSIPDRDAGSSLLNKNALKYDLYDTYRGNMNKNTYIFVSLIVLILIIFVVNML
jgi:hypothetical protein